MPDDFWENADSIKKVAVGFGCLALVWYAVIISAVIAGILWLVNNF